MQEKIFCHNCGKQMPNKVNFCSSCGTNLTSLSSSPPTSSNASLSKSTFEPFSPKDDEDDSYIDRLTKLDIRINRLEVDITKDKPIGETIGSVMSQPMNTGPIVNDRASPTMDEKSFLAEFQKEAGTSRNAKP